MSNAFWINVYVNIFIYEKYQYQYIETSYDIFYKLFDFSNSHCLSFERSDDTFL